MIEGTELLCMDNKHKVTVTKNISNQSFIIESFDDRLAFTRLIEYSDIGRIQYGSWVYLLKGRR
jgi:hypothetical protein